MTTHTPGPSTPDPDLLFQGGANGGKEERGERQRKEGNSQNGTEDRVGEGVVRAKV